MAASPPRSDPAYARAWRGYRIRSIAFWVTIVAILPMFVAVTVFGSAIAGAAWFAAFWTLNVWQSFFRCPRCHDLYFGFWRGTFFGESCASCGLPKWSTDPNDGPSET